MYVYEKRINSDFCVYNKTKKNQVCFLIKNGKLTHRFIQYASKSESERFDEATYNSDNVNKVEQTNPPGICQPR